MFVRACSVLFLCCAFFFAAPNSDAATSSVGVSRYVLGRVDRLPASGGGWQALQSGEEIFPGDMVRTGPNSRAAILCVDESQIKLHENTLMVFKEVAASPRLGYARPVRAAAGQESSLYEVRRGKAWLRNSDESFRFELATPAVTAAIRGTEFLVMVADDGYSRILLLQGRLAIFNPFGSLELYDGEIAAARPGQPPTKQVLLEPEDAVQWTLYYPGIVSFRDVPLARMGNPKTPNNAAMAAYDRGDMATARQLAEEIIAERPGDAGAYTVLGFIKLQEHRPTEALQDFLIALGAPSRLMPATLIGYTLTLYRLGDPVSGYTAYMTAFTDMQPTAELLGMAAFFSLMTGHPGEAAQLLEQGVQLDESSPLCRALQAQMYLVGNRKEEAKRMATELLAIAPDSPLAQLTAGLVAISHFDLQVAEDHLQQALTLDPGFVHAYVYLARLQLGAERLDEARQTVQSGLALAPDNGFLHNMDGFVKLGHRQYDGARVAFQRAIGVEPSLGEPYMGLAMIAFALGEKNDGLRNILSATLLDPRISLYQSVLGKAYYQARAFDKALTTYGYAADLDPNDPTPYLYRGIALTDLNRPGEAIQAINASIAKNNNRAVFRSKLMLDRDLAVRNFDIAKAFAQLGLGEWSYSKALTAVKNDPLNSSAHLFLSSAYAADSQRFAAAHSEFLLYRLLSPANQESFTLYNDYTPMFESTYWRTQIGASAGEWSSGNKVSKASLETYGGRPGLAGYFYGSLEDDGGLRRSNSQTRPITGSAMVKYEPTTSDSLFGGITYYDTESGDDTNLNDWEYQNSSRQEQSLDNHFLELGYVHRFTPAATFIAYVKRDSYNYLLRDYFTDPSLAAVSGEWTSTIGLESDGWSLQAQQQVITGDHTVLAGLEFYEGDYANENTVRLDLFGPGTGVQSSMQSIRFSPDQRSIRGYLLDYWKPQSSTVVELGLSYSSVRAPRPGFPQAIEEDLLGARLGLNWQATDEDVFRLAVQHYLNTDVVFQTTLEPSDVAGFASWLNADYGSTVTEVGVAWEHQWNESTFSVLRLNSHQIDDPQYEALASSVQQYDIGLDRYQARLDVNRILCSSLGLAGQLLYKRLQPNTAAEQRLPNSDFSEFNAALNLSYLNENGMSFDLGGVVVDQQFHNPRAADLGGNLRDSETFGLLSAAVAYEFSEKRGKVSLAVHNIFDTRFSYELEPVSLDVIYPARRIVLSLFLNL